MERFPRQIRFSLALIIAKKEGDCVIYPLGDNFGDENVQRALKLELSQEARTHVHPADDHSTCVRSAGCLILTQFFSVLLPLPAPCSSKCICMYHIMYQWICMYHIMYQWLCMYHIPGSCQWEALQEIRRPEQREV